MATAKRKAAADADAPRKPGKPTKFEPRFSEMAHNMALLGLTDTEMCKVLDITRPTFQVWRKKHPAFDEAVRSGKEVADAKVAKALFDRAVGCSVPDTVVTAYQGDITKTPMRRHFPPEVGAIALWLHNRQPQRWRKDQNEGGGSEDLVRTLSALLQRLPT